MDTDTDCTPQKWYNIVASLSEMAQITWLLFSSTEYISILYSKFMLAKHVFRPYIPSLLRPDLSVRLFPYGNSDVFFISFHFSRS
jgi:hypothetical protein